MGWGTQAIPSSQALQPLWLPALLARPATTFSHSRARTALCQGVPPRPSRITLSPTELPGSWWLVSVGVRKHPAAHPSTWPWHRNCAGHGGCACAAAGWVSSWRRPWLSPHCPTGALLASPPWGRGVPVREGSSAPLQRGVLPALPCTAAHLHTPPCPSGAEGGGEQIPFQVEDFSPREQ